MAQVFLRGSEVSQQLDRMAGWNKFRDLRPLK
jgi:hypothetical protein